MDLTDKELDVLIRLHARNLKFTSFDVGTRRSIFRTLTALSRKGLVRRDQGPGWSVTSRGLTLVKEAKNVRNAERP